MGGNTIFLSYRRDDSPGYASKLESELEQAFGHGRVFRDVQDIEGGRKWKDVIEENLQDSAVLILVIGPRWQQIWQARKQDPLDYVAFELQQAHRHGVRVIPVTLNGAMLSPDIDLGECSWLLANQTYDISDKQRRWSRDVEGLIRLLEGVEGVGKAQSPGSIAEPQKKRSRKMVWIAAVGVALVALTLSVDEEVPVEEEPSGRVDVVAQVERARKPVEQGVQADRSAPDIGGTWQGLDGTLYHVKQSSDGTFTVESPGYSNGSGRFIEGMPNKYEVHMQGVGRGEFAVSSDGRRSVGWILIDGSQQFDTLTRLE